MKYNILYTNNYEHKASKFFKKHPELLKTYSKTLKLLEINPFHPSLRLHKLHGKLSELHSISINMKYHLTMEFLIKDKQIIPLDIGEHEVVYFKH